MRLNLQVATTLALCLAFSNVWAQRGPPSGYGDLYEAYAIWQPVAQPAAARSATPTTDTPKIKVCIGFRMWGTYAPLNVEGIRVFLVELDSSDQIVRWLSEAAFPKRVYPKGQHAEPAPFWCFFSEREQPPTNVMIAKGASRELAWPIEFLEQRRRLAFVEQPATTDLNRLMINWTRKR